MAVSDRREAAQVTDAPPARPRKALTIGAVATVLSKEFDDVSISKIRYLEDQKLVSPRRTAGGYRLYSQADVDRLRTILRLQRDEFLPLRVIRQELSGGPSISGLSSGTGSPNTSRRAKLIGTSSSRFSLEDVTEETGASAEFIGELAEFGLVEPRIEGGTRIYDETDVEIVRAANELAKSGVGARNLRLFKTSADREVQLIEALLAPKFASRNPQRRKEATETLERMASVLSELKHALLVRDLRRLSRS
ncbi:MAG: MerR family transcriptional regulator [Solirubrobacterales bacterium]|jgi:DNA-binding transcriptional MerR regulator|nr:MerR family transcriptional regulator [Solirubrobacterales bacterium]